MMAANVVNASAVVLVRFQTNSLEVFDLFWAAAVICLGLYFLLRIYQNRHKEFPKELSVATRKKLVLHAGFLGFLWSLPGLVILPDAPLIVQAFLIMLAAGMVSGAAISLYPVPAAALLCCSLIAIGHLIGFMLNSGLLFIPFFMVAVMFCIVIIRSITRHESIFVSEFRARRALSIKNASIEQLLKKTREEAAQQQHEAEEKLYQVQKMEAVGQLTAGIAHDFNNLLAVIMGNVELAQITKNRNEVDALLTEAHNATERGAELTRRLLAFGRKASLTPEVKDINSVIRNLAPLVRRSLLSSIRIELDLCPHPCVTKVDVSQLESALLNLAINARDAMEGSGRLVIGTRLTAKHSEDDVAVDAAVPSVMIFVQDNGPGISSGTLARVFEPFFTTKPVGKGSGLGLAMVYGFAKQSGGEAEIQSEPGVGTTVKLFFPSIEDTRLAEARSVTDGQWPDRNFESPGFHDEENLGLYPKAERQL